ncbi:MAG: sulfite exporter TauE/SafE family protein, partial [Burkholderiaceae bacterium]
FVLPAVPYLQALRLDKDEMSQALGLSFTVSTLALGLVLARNGTLDMGSLVQSAVVLGPALLGMAVGQMLRDEMSQAAFKRALNVALVLLGTWLVARNW